jgi:hypothetical protein
VADSGAAFVARSRADSRVDDGGWADTVEAMATFREQAQKRLERANRSHLPYWWRTAMVVSLALGAVVFGFSALGPVSQPSVPGRLSQFALPVEAGDIAPSGPDVSGGAHGDVSGDVPGDVSGGAVLPGPTVPDGAPPSGVGGVREVPSLAGGLVLVPDEAVALARSAASGLFSGEISAVPLAAGFSVPRPSVTFADPQVTDLFVHSGGGERFIFALAVDPDAGGPEPQRAVRVTVTVESGRWVLAGVS